MKVLSTILFIFIGLVALGQNINDLKLLAIKGQQNEVIKLGEKLLAQTPNNEELITLLTNAFMAKSDYDNALKLLKKADKNKLNINNLHFNISQCYYALGNYPAALVYAQKSAAAQPDNILYLNVLGKTQLKEKEWAPACETYDKMCKLDTANSLYFFQLAYAWEQRDSLVDALINYERSFELNDKNQNTILRWSNLLAENKVYKQAKNLLKHGIEVYPESGVLHRKLASVYYAQRNYKKASEYFLNAYHHGDQTFFVYKFLGMSHFKEREFKEAVRFLEKAIRIDDTEYEITYSIAIAYAELYEFELSIEKFEQAERLLVPSDYDLKKLYKAKGYAYLKNGDHENAIKLIEKALECADDPILYQIIGGIYDDNMKKPEKALKAYETFLEKIENSKKRDAYKMQEEFVQGRIIRLKEELHFMSSE